MEKQIRFSKGMVNDVCTLLETKYGILIEQKENWLPTENGGYFGDAFYIVKDIVMKEHHYFGQTPDELKDFYGDLYYNIEHFNEMINKKVEKHKNALCNVVDNITDYKNKYIDVDLNGKEMHIMKQTIQKIDFYSALSRVSFEVYDWAMYKYEMLKD